MPINRWFSNSNPDFLDNVQCPTIIVYYEKLYVFSFDNNTQNLKFPSFFLHLFPFSQPPIFHGEIPGTAGASGRDAGLELKKMPSSDSNLLVVIGFSAVLSWKFMRFDDELCKIYGISMVIFMEYLWWYLWNIYDVMACWWFEPTPPKKIQVDWDDYSQYMQTMKKQTCPKPTTSRALVNNIWFTWIYHINYLRNMDLASSSYVNKWQFHMVMKLLVAPTSSAQAK